MATVQGQLHQFLAEHRDEVLARCEQKMRDDPKLGAESSAIDGLTEVVDEIMRALQHEAGLPADSPLPGDSEAAAQLADNRYQRGFSIGQLALHIGSISDTVGELGTEHHMVFPAREYQLFNQCIDTITSTAVTEY